MQHMRDLTKPYKVLPNNGIVYSTCRDFKEMFPQLGRGNLIIIVRKLSARRRMRDAAEFTKQSLREEAESNY